MGAPLLGGSVGDELAKGVHAKDDRHGHDSCGGTDESRLDVHVILRLVVVGTKRLCGKTEKPEGLHLGGYI